MRTVLLAVLVSCSAPQKSSPPATPPAPPVTQHAAEPWVPVGSMMNPSFHSDTAATDVAAAFAAANIEHVSYGSLGFTISVKASDAKRARDILRRIAHVSVVE
jgi:hypothetical protein